MKRAFIDKFIGQDGTIACIKNNGALLLKYYT